jgi:hypothetical protein
MKLFLIGLLALSSVASFAETNILELPLQDLKVKTITHKQWRYGSYDHFTPPRPCTSQGNYIHENFDDFIEKKMNGICSKIADGRSYVVKGLTLTNFASKKASFALVTNGNTLYTDIYHIMASASCIYTKK